MKKNEGWFVHYDDGHYEDFAEFGKDEDAAWRFYAEMNEESGCCADEPEYDFSDYTDNEIIEAYNMFEHFDATLGLRHNDNQNPAGRYWELLKQEYNCRVQN